MEIGTSRSGRSHARKLAGAEGRLLRGYLPLAVAVVLAAALVAVFPSRTPEAAGGAAAEAGEVGRPASGWDDTVALCPEGGPQVADDPYSPPCYEFSGDNGGATAKGVTAEEIKVTYRTTPEPNTLSLLAGLMGIEFDETTDDTIRTVEGLVEYFNQNFEFYGRRMALEVYQGKGSLTEELTGGGQANASNDGLKAGGELGAFADVSAVTQPYAEGLAKQQVIGFGAPYMSREWFTDRRPYAWSLSTDCSVVAETASSYALARLLGQPASQAGGALEGEPRTLAVISPSNPEYQQCTAAGLKVLDDAGQSPAFVTDYVLDLGRIPNQAASISAQMVEAGVTTITCFCDPFMVMNLTMQMESQGLEPEWIVTGVGFTDLDIIGQGLTKTNDQWLGSFGLSPLAEQQPTKEGTGYRAFKSVRPAEEPSRLVDILYHQIYQLALGIQMAGPELTPANLETGLFSFPVATGPAGTWDWEPGSYTPIIDTREVWWDPEMISPFNGQPGSYRSDGTRYLPEELPEGQPQPPAELGR